MLLTRGGPLRFAIGVFLPFGAATVGCGLIAGVDWDRVIAAPDDGSSLVDQRTDDSFVPNDADPGETGTIDGGRCGSAQVECLSASSGTACCAAAVSVGVPSAIAAGGDTTCAVTTTGQIRCWGSNQNGKLGQGTSAAQLALSARPVSVLRIPSGASQVSVGGEQVCALVNPPGVSVFACWGSNMNASFGNGTTAPALAPVVVDISKGPPTVFGAGNATTCGAIGETGSCWGLNNMNQVGRSAPATVTSPVSVDGLPSLLVGNGAIQAGDLHACAATQSGLYCWGSNGSQRLGVTLTTVPTTSSTARSVVNGAVAATNVAVGGAHACAIATGGKLLCWGSNLDGELGLGVDAGTEPSTGAVAPVGMDVGVTSVCAGVSHTCIVKNGAVLCTGIRSAGNGGADVVRTFTEVAGLVGTGISSTNVACGAYHTCALTTGQDNPVYCWGRNYEGQLGDGSSGPAAGRSTAKPVAW